MEIMLRRHMAQGKLRQADADAFCALLSRVSLSDNVASPTLFRQKGVTIKCDDTRLTVNEVLIEMCNLAGISVRPPADEFRRAVAARDS
jgi:hypothetical protein